MTEFSARDLGHSDDPRDLLAALLTPDPASLIQWHRVIQSSRGKGDRGLVARAEDAVRTSPERTFVFDASGHASFVVEGRRFDAGRFAPRSLGDLRRAIQTGARGGSVRLWALLGDDPLTDIGALQAWASGGTLFQVASQFNGLEAPGACVVPVCNYFSDSTQGPRASISAFPGTLLRHYSAIGPDGCRFVQSDDQQINLLHDALPSDVGQVRSGYLQGSGLRNPAGVAAALEDHFDRIQVGVHTEVEVVLGWAWDGGVEPGRRIAQVFTSTFAGGGYGPEVPITGHVRIVCRQLLRAAYLGTLLAAAEMHRHRVVLTLIGGGVFGNPHPLIWDAICWAVDEAENLGAGPLDVVVNARSIDGNLIDSIKQTTTARNGRALVVG